MEKETPSIPRTGMVAANGSSLQTQSVSICLKILFVRPAEEEFTKQSKWEPIHGRIKARVQHCDICTAKPC